MSASCSAHPDGMQEACVACRSAQLRDRATRRNTARPLSDAADAMAAAIAPLRELVAVLALDDQDLIAPAVNAASVRVARAVTAVNAALLSNLLSPGVDAIASHNTSPAITQTNNFLTSSIADAESISYASITQRGTSMLETATSHAARVLFNAAVQHRSAEICRSVHALYGEELERLEKLDDAVELVSKMLVHDDSPSSGVPAAATAGDVEASVGAAPGASSFAAPGAPPTADALGNRAPNTVNATQQVPQPAAAEGVGTPRSDA